MNASPKSILTRWRRACLLVHEGEYMKASLASDLVEIHGSDASVALADATGIAKVTASATIRLAKLLKVVPDRETWLAVGAYGVRKLVEMPTGKRNATQKKALDAWRSAGKAQLSRGKMKAALGVLPAKAKATRTGSASPSVERDLLAAEFRRLVNGPCPFLIELMTTAAKKTAGIKSKSRKTA